MGSSACYFFSHETSFLCISTPHGRTLLVQAPRRWRTPIVGGSGAADHSWQELARRGPPRINQPHRLMLASSCPWSSICGISLWRSVTWQGYLLGPPFPGCSRRRGMFPVCRCITQGFGQALSMNDQPEATAMFVFPGRCRFRPGTVCAVRHEPDQRMRAEPSHKPDGSAHTRESTRQPKDRKNHDPDQRVKCRWQSEWWARSLPVRSLILESDPGWGLLSGRQFLPVPRDILVIPRAS